MPKILLWNFADLSAMHRKTGKPRTKDQTLMNLSKGAVLICSGVSSSVESHKWITICSCSCTICTASKDGGFWGDSFQDMDRWRHDVFSERKRKTSQAKSKQSSKSKSPATGRLQDVWLEPIGSVSHIVLATNAQNHFLDLNLDPGKQSTHGTLKASDGFTTSGFVRTSTDSGRLNTGYVVVGWSSTWRCDGTNCTSRIYEAN